MDISIHALVKSATSATPAPVANPYHFNPRAREERDHIYYTTYNMVCQISIHALVKSATYFKYYDTNELIISIHALVKSATNN